MHEKIQQATEYLSQANFSDYFRIMKEVVPENLRSQFSELRERFLANDTTWAFHQQLKTFTEKVQEELSQKETAATRPVESIPSAAPPKRVFISYAAKDKIFRDELFDQINIYQKNGRITIWDHSMLVAGEVTSKTVTNLNQANIILLLISSDYLADSYTYDIDFKIARQRHETGQATIIPIIAKPCLWEETWIGPLKYLPAKPVISYPERSVAWLEIAQGIRIHI